MMDAVTSLAYTIQSNKGKYAMILGPDVPEIAEIAEIAELGDVETISWDFNIDSYLGIVAEGLGLIICDAADGSSAYLGVLFGNKNNQCQNFWVSYQKPKGADKELYDFLHAECIYIDAWEVFFSELLTKMLDMEFLIN
ncbi:MAG: hypothetical protein FWG42_11070 [Clostridiales bacterium]|nr:hypothetical protein [Clostridiales bacterium]